MDMDDEKLSLQKVAPVAVKLKFEFGDMSKKRSKIADFDCISAIYRDTSKLQPGNTAKKDRDTVDNEQKERVSSLKLNSEQEMKQQVSKEESNLIEASKENNLLLILDCLGLNHSKHWNKMDDEYMATLGESYNISKDGIESLASAFSRDPPSKELAVLSKASGMDKGGVTTAGGGATNNGDDDDDDDDDEEDDDEEEESDDNDVKTGEAKGNSNASSSAAAILETFVKNGKNVKNGFLLNEIHLRAIVDAIKCRVKVSPLIHFDLGYDASKRESKFQLTMANLLALLLEISHPNVQKIIVSALIEQRLPVPIMYCMSEVSFDERKGLSVNGYLRDNLHLASQSKVRSDGMSQTSVLRDKPLIMFVGSSEVNGKTSMLDKLFTNEKFSICGSKSNPIHKSSVDLVYLSDIQKVNYHILDVHGNINVAYYKDCTSNQASRLDCLVSLSSLCHGVVIEITKDQIRKSKKVNNFLSDYKIPKEKFTIESLISDKKAKDVTSLLNKIQEGSSLCKISLVIRDCNAEMIETFNKGTKDNVFDCDVLCCPSNKTNNYWTEFISSMRAWLDDKTGKVDYMDNNTLKWWKKVEKFGLFLPLSLVKLYHPSLKEYSEQRYKLEHFYREFGSHLESLSQIHGNDDLATKKLKLFPFGKLYEEYSQLIQNSGTSSDNKCEEIGHSILKNVAKHEVSELVKLFICYCLPPPSHYESNTMSWMHSEYLYILDDLCNARNSRVLYNIRKTIKQLKNEEAKTVDETEKKEIQSQLDKQYNKLRDTEVTGYDFLNNSQSLINFVMQFKEELPIKYGNLNSSVSSDINRLMDCVKEFSHRLFLQGTPVEFCDGGYTRMDDEFVNYVFGKDKANLPVVSIAVAGPQSSGKSTLLRRLFGIEARASAGRTTNGINCCKIKFSKGMKENGKADESQIIIVDTEGIASVEKGETNKKRDHKIILGALASSRIFLLNIMKDAASVQIMDVILWAYNKLNLNQSGDSNGRQLKDIKFIFIIRDVTEQDGSSWLEKQRNEINKTLTESLRSIQAVSKGNEKGKSINKIEDVIGEPVFFPMPSAFDKSNAPNEYFAQRCVQLRSLIFKELSNVNINNSYQNSKDWCLQMINIWDTVVRFEDVLTPSDFREQSQRQAMQKAVGDSIDAFQNEMHDFVNKLSQKWYKANDNNDSDEKKNDEHKKKGGSRQWSVDSDKRFISFKQELTEEYETKIEQYKTNLSDSEELSFVENGIKEQYCYEFENRVNTYKIEQIESFKERIKLKQTLEFADNIKDDLYEKILKLRETGITDTNEIKREYDLFFQELTEKTKKDYKSKEKMAAIESDIEKRLNRAYEKTILLPNQRHGYRPSALKQLMPYIPAINGMKRKNQIEYIKIFRGSWDIISKVGDKVSDKMGWKCEKENEFYQSFAREMNKIVKQYITEKTRNDTHEWMKCFHDLDSWLDSFERTEKYYSITDEFRIATHCELKTAIFDKLKTFVSINGDKILKDIELMHRNEWQLFEQRVRSTKLNLSTCHVIRDDLCNKLRGVIRDQLNNICKSYFEILFINEDVASKLRFAFFRAFGTENGTVEQAWKFIQYNGQETAIQEVFDNDFKTEKENLLTLECGQWNEKVKSKLSSLGFDKHDQTLFNHLSKMGQAVLDAIINGIKQIENNENEMKKIENRQSTVFYELLWRQVKNMGEATDICEGVLLSLPRSDIQDAKEFIELINGALTNTKVEPSIVPTGKEMRQMFDQIEGDIKSTRFHEYIGCENLCPYCQAKCSKPKNHGGKHETKFHLLQAFGGCHSTHSKKLTVDICTTEHNVNKSRWTSDDDNGSWTWNQHVEKKHHDWYPITATDFNLQSAKAMKAMYYGGLQDRLVKKYDLKPNSKCQFDDRL